MADDGRGTEELLGLDPNDFVAVRKELAEPSGLGVFAVTVGPPERKATAPEAEPEVEPDDRRPAAPEPVAGRTAWVHGGRCPGGPTPYSCFSTESPISQNMGGQRPTKSARRSALPRASWSTVLARIHSEHGRSVGDPGSRKVLDGLHDKSLNFELAGRDGPTAGDGWKSDEYCQPLPPEPPGPPVPGGSWEVAQVLIGNYEFADPSIVRAVYYPDRPLEERDMLLEVRFYGLRFRFGVRVGGVVDETRTVDGREVRVWGWNYRTLQGHLEMGQMDYEVRKWLDTGEVEFRTCRFSRRAPSGNPVVRLGVRVFGRRQQVRFSRHACDRMARLTAAALDDGNAADGTPRVADQVAVCSSASLGG